MRIAAFPGGSHKGGIQSLSHHGQVHVPAVTVEQITAVHTFLCFHKICLFKLCHDLTYPGSIGTDIRCKTFAGKHSSLVIQKNQRMHRNGKFTCHFSNSPFLSATACCCLSLNHTIFLLDLQWNMASG